jgi:hypothetical protein
MKTPVKVTLEEYHQARCEWLKENTHTVEELPGLRCLACGGRVRVEPVTLELHARGLPGCQGDGETMLTGIPYCPGCEELPAKTGCVHV